MQLVEPRDVAQGAVLAAMLRGDQPENSRTAGEHRVADGAKSCPTRRAGRSGHRRNPRPNEGQRDLGKGVQGQTTTVRAVEAEKR